MVAGGLELMSYTTRFTPRTLLMMSLDTLARKSYGRWHQSAVIPSVEVTARKATACSYVRSSVRRGLAQVGGRVDVCVTPVRSVDVAGFALVAGGGAAADLVEALGTPRLVLPLRNGELAQTGASVGLLGTDGTTGESFARLCDARFGKGAVTVQMPVPGAPIRVFDDDT